MLEYNAPPMTNNDNAITSNEKSLSTNTSEKHICLTCGKVFLKRWSLAKHRLIHEGIAPFYCAMCNNLFTKLTKLTNHAKTHSECTGMKLFKCELCAKGF